MDSCPLELMEQSLQGSHAFTQYCTFNGNGCNHAYISYAYGMVPTEVHTDDGEDS